MNCVLYWLVEHIPFAYGHALKLSVSWRVQTLSTYNRRSHITEYGTIFQPRLRESKNNTKEPVKQVSALQIIKWRTVASSEGSGQDGTFIRVSLLRMGNQPGKPEPEVRNKNITRVSDREVQQKLSSTNRGRKYNCKNTVEKILLAASERSRGDSLTYTTQ
jgi:hypothetical protein